MTTKQLFVPIYVSNPQLTHQTKLAPCSAQTVNQNPNVAAAAGGSVAQWSELGI